MIFVNTSLAVSIFQSSIRKLPHFQMKPELSLLQWVIGMLVSLFCIATALGAFIGANLHAVNTLNREFDRRKEEIRKLKEYLENTRR